jgi:hypothetical protein
MRVTVLTGMALIVLPIAFNILFAALARSFDYPDILRREPAGILERFRAGGRRLMVTWWLFALSALALVPVAGLLAAELAPAGDAFVEVSLALGVTAGLVQALGLMRWPFLVPLLANRHAVAATAEERVTLEVVFAAMHRFLGVAVGEHLGYLLTGAWTVVVGLALVGSPAHPDWLGWLGLAIGCLLAVGSLEFVGYPGERGWPVAERLVPIAYLAWSIWLVALGAALVLGLS